MQKWEYRIEVYILRIEKQEREELNSLLTEYGSEGWELVNIIPQYKLENNLPNFKFLEVQENLLVFKRLVE
ncbi:DUF4177 domain-containing protein [Cytobacillus praedii]|uniref:DUF4177 domain-containing protein n=1 Tax=Cytobacillus praedii TaxID=1742358 RepID=UPI0013F4571B|nr:DUF4177 domain-containing protein [Cytobacillus praedii]